MAPVVRSGIGMEINRQAARVRSVGDWESVEVFADEDRERHAARETVALVDASAVGKYWLSGRAVPDALRAAFGTAPTGFRDVAMLDHGWITRVNRYAWYCVASLEHGGPGGLEAQLPRDGAFLTDITHSLDILQLVGPRSADTLSKLCSLNLEEFPPGTAESGGLAKIKALVARIESGPVPVYEVHVDRSYGAYLWETLLDAAAEFDGRAAGTAVLPLRDKVPHR